MRIPNRPFFASAAAVVSLIFTVITTPVTYAFSLGMQDGANAAKGIEQVSDLFGTTGIFNTITSVLLFAIGAISVIMIIIGGLRYIISGGNSATVTAAKNTILYAIVGLIVALLAYAVVNFVLTSFSADGFGGGGDGLDV